MARVSKLVSCRACGHRIAATAQSCPECGAVNEWVHPEIRRFLRSLDQFDHMPPFDFTHQRLVLTCKAEVTRGEKALMKYAVGALCVSLLLLVFGGVVRESALAGLAVGAGVLTLLASIVFAAFFGLHRGKNTDWYVNCRIDFRMKPPQWWSDDEEFWRDVRAFFFEEETE